jgi:hypothetical protein
MRSARALEEQRPEGPAERFAAILDLYEFAVEQMRANLRRRHPELDEAARDRMLAEWLLDRPCAPEGDSAGRLRASLSGPA